MVKKKLSSLLFKSIAFCMVSVGCVYKRVCTFSSFGTLEIQGWEQIRPLIIQTFKRCSCANSIIITLVPDITAMTHCAGIQEPWLDKLFCCLEICYTKGMLVSFTLQKAPMDS